MHCLHDVDDFFTLGRGVNKTAAAVTGVGFQLIPAQVQTVDHQGGANGLKRPGADLATVGVYIKTQRLYVQNEIDGLVLVVVRSINKVTK